MPGTGTNVTQSSEGTGENVGSEPAPGGPPPADTDTGGQTGTPDPPPPPDLSNQPTGEPQNPKDFRSPTNPPQEPPPSVLPRGIQLRIVEPSKSIYTHGHWYYINASGQRLNPWTLRPGSHEVTHVPLPEGYSGPYGVFGLP
jgi:hypothetical protein